MIMNVISFFKKKIPSFRHKKQLQIFDNSPNFFKTKTKTKTLIKRQKYFYKNKQICFNKSSIHFNSIITQKYIYQFKPYKKYICCQTIDNFKVYIPGIEYLVVGKILYNLKWHKEKNVKFFYKGVVCLLKNVPVLSIFSNVNNLLNSKVTYSKAGGTFCSLKLNKKTKSKLISVTLPSKENVLLSKITKVYFGKNTNFKIQKLVEGKWGFSFYVKKKINVRGVAMNPVDHPNGGRTKSVQPEKSPWNWIAKHKK